MPAAQYDTYSLIEANAENNPASTAIIVPGKGEVTYSQLFHNVKLFQSALRSYGISRNHRVAIVLPAGSEMAITLFSVSASAASVPLNPDYQEDEFQSYISLLNVDLLITLAGYENVARNVASSMGIPVVELVFTGLEISELKSVSSPDVKGLDEQPDTPRSGGDVALVLFTSGTTSKPKIVPLTHRNIGVAVDYICSTLDLGPGDRCLSMMPQFHIGGLVDLLLAPLASGGSVIATTGFDVDLFFDCLKQYRPTWYQAVPASLLELVSVSERTRDRLTDSSLRFIRAVSAPLPVQTLDRVEDFFERPVLEIYGMTEAAPIIAANPIPPGKRKKGAVGKSVGPEIRILDENRQPVANGVTGEIVIHGANVISGYENNPEVNEKSFHDGWFHTGDMGYLDEDGYLFIRGRLNEIINRGGEKVSPYEVDDVLLQHPAIEEAVTFPVEHKVLGEDVAAAVVVRPDYDIDEAQLLAYLRERLANFKVPQRIALVDDIPRGDTGKFQRATLSSKISLTSNKSFLPPRTKIEKQLAKIWSELLTVDQVGRDDNFFNLGGYSLLAMRLVTEVEKQTGLRFPLEALNQSLTIESLANKLEKLKSKSSGSASVLQEKTQLMSNQEAFKMMQAAVLGGKFPPLRDGALITSINAGEEQSNTNKPFFWCFNAPDREMLTLAIQQGPGQPIYGMLSGARVLKDANLVNAAIAKHYAQEIQELYPDKTIRLGGNCRGADIASQVAIILTQKGYIIEKLCLVDFFHPRLFTFPGEMLLLFGKESHVTSYKEFRWGSEGWESLFQTAPQVEWTPGAHGEFFISPNIEPLSQRISLFMNGNA
jgi:acyl-CoA synthetase (AMP-forming)/AMP-acid ligase II/acyl carrier protein